MKDDARKTEQLHLESERRTLRLSGRGREERDDRLLIMRRRRRDLRFCNARRIGEISKEIANDGLPGGIPGSFW